MDKYKVLVAVLLAAMSFPALISSKKTCDDIRKCTPCTENESCNCESFSKWFWVDLPCIKKNGDAHGYLWNFDEKGNRFECKNYGDSTAKPECKINGKCTITSTVWFGELINGVSECYEAEKQHQIGNIHKIMQTGEFNKILKNLTREDRKRGEPVEVSLASEYNNQILNSLNILIWVMVGVGFLLIILIVLLSICIIVYKNKKPITNVYPQEPNVNLPMEPVRKTVDVDAAYDVVEVHNYTYEEILANAANNISAN